jgi:hypothetical protein
MQIDTLSKIIPEKENKTFYTSVDPTQFYDENSKPLSKKAFAARGASAKDSIVSLWTPFELTKLGSIEHVDFELISTKDGVPPYFCMDNMVFKVDITY